MKLQGRLVALVAPGAISPKFIEVFATAKATRASTVSVSLPEADAACESVTVILQFHIPLKAL